MSRLNEIQDYLKDLGYDGEALISNAHQSVGLSMQIAEYAHRDQKRENGEEYVNHPYRCLAIYREFVGIVPNEYDCIDVDLLYEYNIPFEGVQELSLLHDVVEDSDFTVDEIGEIFDECDLGNYFDVHIRKPLELITHDKNDDYEEYILKCSKHPSSALVKMIDMQDNVNAFTLSSYDKDKYERAFKYFKYIFLINKVFEFIENVNKYKIALNK